MTTLDDCTFFSSDSLWHADAPLRTVGLDGTATPFRLAHEGIACPLLLLLCLVLAVLLLQRFRGKWGELWRGYFLPVSGKKDDPANDDPLTLSTRLMAVSVLSVSAALLTFCAMQHRISVYPFPESPYVLLAAYILLWMAYFLVKHLAEQCIGWVFFERDRIFTYTRSGTLLLSLQSLVFLAFAVAAIYVPVAPRWVPLIALFLVAFAKIIALFKVCRIFSPKMHGALHLFVYLCTFELIPLYVMTKVLTYLDWIREVKI